MNLQALRSSISDGVGDRNVCVLFAALICTILPLEISQLALAVLGALAYALIQAFQPRRKTNCQLAAEREQGERTIVTRTQRQAVYKGKPAGTRRQVSPPEARTIGRTPYTKQNKADVYCVSSVPVCALKFESSGWEAEASELLSQLTPAASEEQAIQRLVLHVKQTIQFLFPDVEVSGFAHASLTCGKAFGVAVPEVDIVANISPAALAQRLQQRSQNIDVKRLQKSAIRLCTDRLVASGGLKFRRSAFRGEEPRVTLLVPSALGFFEAPIPVHFSINAVTPFYTAALLTECGQIQPRAKELILLVRRWAKDRGICHAAKGHLSPYMWSLLTMYFMQTGVEDEGPLLPTLADFKISSNLMMSSTASSLKSNAMGKSSPPPPPMKASANDVAKLSIGELFGKFLHFYTKSFNWTGEAISIRAARRARPSLSVPLHVIVGEDGTTRVGPAIEDPFQAGNNLGSCMNLISLTRLHEELARGNELYNGGASLAELLVPWVPAEEAPDKISPRSSGSSSGDLQK